MLRNLKQTAQHLGIKHKQLIRMMREAGLLNDQNLPAHPMRDKFYLQTKQGQWYHPKLGMQHSASTRVTQYGINWLADKLGIERPKVPEERPRVA
ncbi:phage antirepressor KilAC domain-containing protein [Halopseudomonas laoshanensis]|uniref:phage antirepressor KilAC domain-containing protein n=1 Tax=Halopseudomonas laoshanensis TaxID=2268758 RepID=UPI003735DB53